VNQEVIDFFHEAIDATIIVVSNPREKVVDGFFQLWRTLQLRPLITYIIT